MAPLSQTAVLNLLSMWLEITFNITTNFNSVIYVAMSDGTMVIIHNQGLAIKKHENLLYQSI